MEPAHYKSTNYQVEWSLKKGKIKVTINGKEHDIEKIQDLKNLPIDAKLLEKIQKDLVELQTNPKAFIQSGKINVNLTEDGEIKKKYEKVIDTALQILPQIIQENKEKEEQISKSINKVASNLHQYALQRNEYFHDRKAGEKAFLSDIESFSKVLEDIEEKNITLNEKDAKSMLYSMVNCVGIASAVNSQSPGPSHAPNAPFFREHITQLTTSDSPTRNQLFADFKELLRITGKLYSANAFRNWDNESADKTVKLRNFIQDENPTLAGLSNFINSLLPEEAHGG